MTHPSCGPSFQLWARRDRIPLDQIVLPSLLCQSKPPSARAAWPQHPAAEMRQENSPPPCLGQSNALTAASLGAPCHGQLKVTEAGAMHLQEVNVPPALGLMETSRMLFLLPAPDRMNLTQPCCSPLAMQGKLQCNLMKY